MRKARAEPSDLQIAHFIKQPQNLKLLILAGTQLQPSQFTTIKQCINLIKLDLSSNNLKSIPIPLSDLRGLKILFLHNNQFPQIQSTNIKDSQAEYVTLFGNPVKNYRRYLINNLPKVKGVDFNMLCGWERSMLIKDEKKLPAYTEVKWPIVELEKGLENEIDYLNLLKAEVFVLNNVYTRSHFSEVIERYITAVPILNKIDHYVSDVKTERMKRDSLVKKCADKWRDYTMKCRRARQIVTKRGRPYLMFNKIQYKKHLRSNEANNIIRRYVDYIRLKVKSKKILFRNLLKYSRMLQRDRDLNVSVNIPIKIYIHKSDMVVFQKVFLYTKKYLFNLKMYDLCDNFNDVVRVNKKPGNELVILRQQTDLPRPSELQRMVARTMNLVVIKDYTSKRNVMYTKKGHADIIKIQKKGKTKLNTKSTERYQDNYHKLEDLYSKYDRLTQMQVRDMGIYKYFHKILKCFNNGGSSKILNNVAAYFQTQVPQEDQIDEIFLPFLKRKIQVYHADLIDRARSAVVIQKWWRSKLDLKKVRFSTIKEINRVRAACKLQKWARNLTFQHIRKFKREYPFYEKTINSNIYYIQLFVYMKLPMISDYLCTERVNKLQTGNFMTTQDETQWRDLYELLHKNCHIKMIYKNNRQWVRVEFPNILEARARIKFLTLSTYRFYFNGHYLRLFTLEEITNGDLSNYEKQIKKSFRMTYDPAEPKIDNFFVNNQASVFIVEQGNPALTPKISKLPFQITRRVKLNMFVLNSKKRPLKVQCEFNITIHTNIYLENNLAKQFSIRKPMDIKDFKQSKEADQTIPDLYLAKQVNRLRSVKMTSRRDSRHNSMRETPNHSPSSRNIGIGINSLKLISETMPFKKK